MNIFKPMRFHIVALIIIAASIVFTYWNLPKTFFQQDEWWAFGIFIEQEQKGGIIQVLYESLFQSGKVHVNPITVLILYLEYSLFYMDFRGYAIVSMALHVVNALLVYYLTLAIFGKKVLSFFISLLFSLSSISHQAVSWVATSINTQGSIMFSLLFSLLFVKYVRGKRTQRTTLVLAVSCMFFVLLIKETVLPFFLLGAFIYLYSTKRKLATHKQLFWPVGIVAALYLLFRAVVYIVAPPVTVGSGEILEQPGVATFLYRFMTLPIKAFPESLLPMDWLLALSRTIIRLGYPHFVLSDSSENPYLVEGAGLDLVNLVISTVLGAIAYGSYVLLKSRKDLRKGILLSFVFIVGGTQLIIFISGKAGYVSIIEPRHLYGATIGGSFLTVLILYSIVSRINHRVFRYLLFVLPLMIIVFVHVRFIHRDLTLLRARSDLRKSFLTSISRDYPTLPDRVVFYTQSDRPYYGKAEDEKILPVQSGFGRMLMVWYQRKERLPGCLFSESNLHGLLSEGYRYCGNRGFGYVRSLDSLIRVLKENQLPSGSVIAYSWNGKTQEFQNVTRELRKRIEKDLNQRTL